MTGTIAVKKDSGFGFITPGDGGKDVFFHASALVDIAFDDELFSRYGVTIPVLNYSGSELGWPFDREKLKQWLDDNGITYHS